MGLRLGLDIGTNSIGWAVFQFGEDKQPVELLDAGVRIYSDGRNPKNQRSLAATRRLPRGIRRNRDRKIKRRDEFMSRLITFGLMPADEAERKKLETLDPWRLRVEGLDRKLSHFELGRALFHLQQRRGFKSNRKTDSAADDSGKIIIVEHWEKRRAAMEGKAMVVTMSRDIAARLYEAIRARRPDWHDADDERGAMKVVITGTGDDPEPLRSHVRTKAARKRLAERFKRPEDDLRLVVVCDMWLTGFDCPPAHTMYLDKPLAGHNLMQAIARVNRVHGEKPGGLIVDLLGLADQLADALATYTQAGGTGEAVRQVQDEAVPAMQAAFEKLRDFFHGCDYEPALNAAPATSSPSTCVRSTMSSGRTTAGSASARWSRSCRPPSRWPCRGRRARRSRRISRSSNAPPR